jgi:hypothetical protein
VLIENCQLLVNSCQVSIDKNLITPGEETVDEQCKDGAIIRRSTGSSTGKVMQKGPYPGEGAWKLTDSARMVQSSGSCEGSALK